MAAPSSRHNTHPGRRMAYSTQPCVPVCWAMTVEAGRQVDDVVSTNTRLLLLFPSKTKAALLDWNSSGKSYCCCCCCFLLLLFV
jgi:hypothetical protein